MSRMEYYILQSHFPQRARIVLDKTSVGGVPYNTVGRVVYINRDMNTILVDFDNGAKSSLIFGVDMFHRDVNILNSR